MLVPTVKNGTATPRRGRRPDVPPARNAPVADGFPVQMHRTRRGRPPDGPPTRNAPVGAGVPTARNAGNRQQAIGERRDKPRSPIACCLIRIRSTVRFALPSPDKRGLSLRSLLTPLSSLSYSLIPVPYLTQKTFAPALVFQRRGAFYTVIHKVPRCANR